MPASLKNAIRVFLAAAAFSTLGVAPSFAATQSSCDVASVVRRALPAIVNITEVRVGGADEKSPEVVASAGPSATPNDHIAIFVGTGSIIDPSGIIITNRHVIQGAAMIKVTFADKTSVPAQLIAAASLMDLALLKVDVPHPLPTMPFGDSDALQLGEPVIAIGNPLGIGTSISTGVVSALNRDLMRTPLDNFVQTDAAINPGNSGGPLLDCSGKMIGVNTALLSNNSLLGSIGLGFALPANDARFVAHKLMDPDNSMPNWIGLHLQDLSSDIATTFGRADLSGAIVSSVDPNSPAASANVQSGDIIMGMDGEAFHDARAILRNVITLPSDATVTLDIWRNGHSINATLKTVPWPHMKALRSEVLANPEDVERAEAEGCGLHLADITSAARMQYHIPDMTGVYVNSVTAGSEAETMGFRPGDVIEKIDNVPVKTADEVKTQVSHGSAASGDLVSVLVHNMAGSKWLTLYVGRVDVSELVATPNFLGLAGARDSSARAR